MFELFKKTIWLGAGLAVMTAEKIEEAVAEIVKKGHLSEKEGKELLDENLPCVAFYHMNSRENVGLDSSRICVSGWEFHSPCRQISDKEHLIALSDHSDFDGLIEYVRRAKPKQVVTDNYRMSYGETLAKEISKRLGIPAVAMP